MKKLLVLAVVQIMVASLLAQEHHHETTDTSRLSGEGKTMDHDGMPLMSHAYSLNLPMSRNGSGTAWLPDTSPMYMYMRGNAKSNWMVHGNVVLLYNNQDVFNKG